MIGTDSWDTTQLKDGEAEGVLVGHSYVIIPDSSAGNSLFGGRSLKMCPKCFDLLQH